MRSRAPVALLGALGLVTVMAGPAEASGRANGQGSAGPEQIQAEVNLLNLPERIRPVTDGRPPVRPRRGGGGNRSPSRPDPTRELITQIGQVNSDVACTGRLVGGAVMNDPNATCVTPGRAAPRAPQAPSGPAPVEVARTVLSQAPLPLPGVRTSPPPAIDQLVNLPTWMWVDSWEPVSVTAALPEAGASVTVTATPRHVTWDMGNGDQVVCTGPGTPYRRGAGSEESPDCGYNYRRSSAGQPDLRYQASATMTWDASWVATGVAGGGSLGQVSTTTSFGLRVAEIQTINTPISD